MSAIKAIPQDVLDVLQTLTNSGFQAYLVGGCVRDSLLGLPVKDWDVTTNARPDQVQKCWPRRQVLETGLRHGTLTVLLNGMPVEITSYRGCSEDTPNQDPAGDLAHDLSRRDFTINALAYHPEEGLIDPCGGLEDLWAGRISCVGDPEARLREDPLRILRALRFSATLGFAIEPRTRSNLNRCRELLAGVAAERLAAELMRLLAGSYVKKTLLTAREILAVFLPEIAATFDFDQCSPYHCWDVWRHTAESVSAMGDQDASLAKAGHPWTLLRLVMLLHDLGKPLCFSRDRQGIGHFYGHPQISAALAHQILRRLKVSTHTLATVKTLVLYHDTAIEPQPKSVRRWLYRLGAENLIRLLHVKRADTLAHNPAYHDRLGVIAEVQSLIEETIKQGYCFTRHQLKITGSDLLALGIPAGPQIGALLDTLMDLVLDEVCPNEREALLTAASRILQRC